LQSNGLIGQLQGQTYTGANMKKIFIFIQYLCRILRTSCIYV